MRTWQRKLLVWSMAVMCSGTLVAVPQAHAAVDIGSALKLFGISYVVDLFSKELDSFINTVTMNKGLGKGEATKVVPIVSAGTGGYVGAAQVTGPSSQVAKVQAVGQLEGDFFSNSVRAKALVPLDSKNPLQGLHRVDQVGVSAIIDITIEASNPPAPAKPAPAPVPSPPPAQHPPVTVPTGDERPVLQRYPALGYPVFASEDVQITGNNITVNGDVRANDDVTMKGHNLVVTGRVYAGDKMESDGRWTHGHGHEKSSGSSWQRVSSLSMPHFSWTELQRRAVRIYGGGFTLRPSSPVVGVTAIDGDLLIDGRLQGGGLVIVRGNVTITKNGADADRGLLIWAGGDIKVPESNTSINAMLISDHSIKVTGTNVKIRGGLVGRNVYLTGNNISVIKDTMAARYLPY